MKALVTGASSGIGKSIAMYLASLGYDLYVVSQDRDELQTIYKGIKVKVVPIEIDLSSLDNLKKLYLQLKDKDIDILVNNAGFGDAGKFIDTSLQKEMNMIDVNIRAYHVLTKLFLRDFTKKNRGRILNVASMAGFMPGPYMACYYATKAYILNLSLAISEELSKDGSNVKISVFCPGPVDTDFNRKAHVHFNIKEIDADVAAKLAVDGMFSNRLIIVPNNMKLNRFLVRIVPVKWLLYFNSFIQERN